MRKYYEYETNNREQRLFKTKPKDLDHLQNFHQRMNF